MIFVCRPQPNALCTKYRSPVAAETAGKYWSLAFGFGIFAIV
jgi:hypothetical protein